MDYQPSVGALVGFVSDIKGSQHMFWGEGGMMMWSIKSCSGGSNEGGSWNCMTSLPISLDNVTSNTATSQLECRVRRVLQQWEISSMVQYGATKPNN